MLLLVLPFAAASVVLQAHWWAVNVPQTAIWTLGISLIFGLIVHRLRAATPAAAFTGAVIAASLMFSTANFPYQPWRTALLPLLALFLLSFIATRMGRATKESLGTAERRQGRTAAQVAANLGIAALVSSELIQSWLANTGLFLSATASPVALFVIGLAALAEATADTISSEIGQIIGGRPRMLTTMCEADPGTDGAISLAGTAAGIVAGAAIAVTGSLALGGGWEMFWIALAGAVFGLFFDSLLGATLERRGLLNNDMVNFLSTASAAAFAVGLLAILSHFTMR